MDYKQYFLYDSLYDVCVGFSKVEASEQTGGCDFYIKHPSMLDQINGNRIIYEKFRSLTREGFISQDAIIKDASISGGIDPLEQSKYEMLLGEIKRIELTISQTSLPSEKKQLKPILDNLKKSIAQHDSIIKNINRGSIESICDKEYGIWFVDNFLFLDKDFERPAVESDFDDKVLFDVSALFFSRISHTNLRFMACLDLVLSIYGVGGEALIGSSLFSGGEITYYQYSLIRYAKYFAKILASIEDPIPDEMHDNPTKLCKYCDDYVLSCNKKNKQQQAAAPAPKRSGSRHGSRNKPTTSSSFVFVDDEDKKNVNIDFSSGNSEMKRAQRKGGLGIFDMIKS